MTEQTLDRADPAVQEIYLRLHRRDRWKTSRVSLTGVAVPLVIVVYAGTRVPTLPDGPVRRETGTQLKRAPGGTL